MSWIYFILFLPNTTSTKIHDFRCHSIYFICNKWINFFISIWTHVCLKLRLDGREFEWTPGFGDGHGGLAAAIHGMAKSQTELNCSASLIAQLVKNPPAMQETTVWFLSGRSAGEGIGYPLQYSWASSVAQLIKNLPAMWETWVGSLGWEDTLEKGKATHYSILPGEFYGLSP